MLKNFFCMLLLMAGAVPAVATAQYQVTHATVTQIAAAGPTAAAAGPAAARFAIEVDIYSPRAASGLLVDLEVHDPSGNKIGQQTFTTANYDFVAGETHHFQWTYTMPSTEPTGTYSVVAGVFTARWASKLYWNTAAASFGYTAVPLDIRLVSASVGPGLVNAGQIVHIAAAFESSIAAGGLVVNLELHDPLGVKVGQWYIEGQNFPAHVPQNYAWDFVVPPAATPKSYSLTVGVVLPGFTTRYLWVDTQDSFAIVGPGICLTPAPSRFESESAAKTYGFSMHGGIDYDQLADTGAGVVRTNLYWSSVETTPGVYDFAATDAVVSKLVARNLTPLLILGYGNPLYTGGGATVAQWSHAFAKYAAAAAAHYKGKGVLWEIWNEPDGTTFWDPPSASAYASLVMTAAPAIRAADDSAPILAGVTSGVDWLFVQGIARAGVLSTIDAISVHPYRHTEPETVATDLATLRAVMESAATPCARQLPIVSSEWGYSTTWNTGASAPYSAMQQGYFLAREWLMGSYLGLPASIWYDFEDDGTDPTNPEHNFGAVSASGAPLPAYASAQNLASQLQGFTFSHRVPTGDPTVWSLLFLSGKEVAVVNWTDAASRIADTANIPVVYRLNPSSAGYAQNFRSAELLYPQNLLMAAPGKDVLVKFVIQNNEASAANIVLTVGAARAAFSVAPGQRFVSTQELSVGSTMNLTPTLFPVSMTWNGAAVPKLPPVQVANFAAITIQPGFPLGSNCSTMSCYNGSD
jgi:hypothetical protein